ncbi:MAG TPA: class A beta-lactamase-related serine hydrolase, partial [Spirochaetes bacterium]|nr:class A beta-lactamase-related serine hydrolase [Spirochaetota bacterium]
MEAATMIKPGPAPGRLPATAVILLAFTIAAAPTLHAEAFTPDAGLAFFNDTVPILQERYHIPGAGVALVHKGKTVFLGGYGQADLENRIHVNPKHTVFRCGSISKLITVTAVMGLYERKLLDPGKNVNLYLRKTQIADTFPEPVTLEHLMTHTAGFDERFTGIAARDEKSSLSLSAYLA